MAQATSAHSAFAPDLHSCAKANGPVTHAIRAVRTPHLDAAINRLLTGRDEPEPLQPEKKPFGPNREHLCSLTMNGLLALHDAYAAVADVFYLPP